MTDAPRMSRTPTLRFQDCRLRPLAAADSDRLLAWRNQDRVRANMYSDHVIGAEEHARWLAVSLVSPDAVYLIYEYQDRPLGFVSFTGIDRHNARCSWAFYLGEADAPRGSGAAMELLALDRVFGDIGIGKLCCEVFAFNAAVIRLHKRFGFVEEGRLVRHARKDDQLQDVVLLARFGDNWPDDRPALMNTVFEGPPA
ncbi:UDP-4-amino-4,6-dideoxy-N-acetyl-beta-L-altrosamine N-acetyltransferase [uncultured Brevundimonas sp.]|uniref:UDP-4-amino-4, 6-dideoxy-N-acetyl-beta-L-altrosamine N-acetyltransferase n=1 Tax=uncultured Brevundimonas sp. TaxID=213418 RepID=UPI0030EB9F24|tara:strand:+ start:36400 stop:36993 length:594 start_codon:yes stop_codon:yes gene_type:complete